MGPVNVDDGEAVIIGTARAVRNLLDASWPSCRISFTVHIQGALEPADGDQVRMARDATTSPADFAAGLQPCPPAALPLPQALGRFLQKTGLPPCPCRLALSRVPRPCGTSAVVRVASAFRLRD